MRTLKFVRYAELFSIFVQYMILNSFFGIITTFCIMPYGDCVWLNMYLSWYELLHVFASATTIHIILALFHVSLLVNKLSILLFKWVNKYLLLFYLHIFYTICKYYTLLTHFFFIKQPIYKYIFITFTNAGVPADIWYHFCVYFN